MKSIILSLLMAVALISCTNYGKKVPVEGTKCEVLYKGEGVTEADAKKLGEYLKESGMFTAEKKSNCQLMQSNDGGYDIRFVIEEKTSNEHPEFIEELVKLGAALSNDVFGNKPVNIMLTNTRFKEYKTLPFDKEMAKKLMEPTDSLPTENITEPVPDDSLNKTDQ